MIKKMMSLGVLAALVASPLGFASGALAATSSTPEMTLLQSTIALEGQNLPPDDLQTALSTLVTTYMATTQATGQQQRMENALVRLNMYTSTQAHALINDVTTRSRSLTQTKATATTETALQMTLSTEIARVVSAYPAGAQFSVCSAATPLLASAAAGFLTGGIVWALASGHNGSGAIQDGAEGITALSGIAIIIGVVMTATNDC